MRFLLLFFCFFLSSCVEKLIHISVFSNGTYTIKYNSVGDKKDLEDNDFIHPTDSENLYWVSSIQKKESTQFEALNTWEKETILKTPTKEKLIFSNSDNMQYYIVALYINRRVVECVVERGATRRRRNTSNPTDDPTTTKLVLFLL